MSSLKIEVLDLENPYRDVIAGYLAREFPANLENKAMLLDGVTDAIIGSSKVRFGPTPNPENLVSIRAVIARAIATSSPIPVLSPWGSKKPVNTSSIDVAELGGLKTLRCLQSRVTALYAPGLQINLRVEDVGGFYLFAEEGEAARRASAQYVEDFGSLVRILGLNFITMKLESSMMREQEYVATAEAVRPLLQRYLADTDSYGFEGIEELESWRDLRAAGWQGIIPKEQRDYYRGLYAKLYPADSVQEQTRRLAKYLAGSLARYQLHGTGAEAGWGKSFLNLSFVCPIPGNPAALEDRRIYYRTLPTSMSRTHIPAWRARGFLKITGNEVTPKLTTWSDPLELESCTVTYSLAGESVQVRADHLNE